MQGIATEKLEARRQELKLKKLEIQKKILRYRERNLLEYFDTPPNPGPNPKQAQIIEAFQDISYKIMGMFGGNRFGKTTLLTIIGISVMIGKFLWNNQSILHLFPHKKPRKVRYIGQGWQDHVKAVVIPEMEKWWPQNRKVQRRGNGVITDTFWKDLKTGSTMEIMSNNQRTKEHEGWSGDIILYDEPCRREIYVANARGLVDRQGRELFAATLLDEPWIDREIIRKVDEFGKPDRTVFCVEGTGYDNVGYGISREGLEEFRAKLDEDEEQARIFGVPQYKSGLVFPQFKRNIHLKERFDIPLDWMVDIAIDIHPRERQAVLFIATDSRNDRYGCEEIWDFGDGTWVAEQIIRIITKRNYRINKIIIDPLSKGDSNNPETTFQKIFNILAQHEYVLEVASKDKDAGILEIKDHLKGPNNQASIFFFDDMVRTLFEIEGWMWDKETNKALDKDDHMMENLYRLCLLDTQWTDPQDDFYYNYGVDKHSDNRNITTGY